MREYECIKVIYNVKSAWIYLNRPEIHNALNDVLINELFDAFQQLKTDSSARVIILTGEGRSFCAGADLNWMKGVVRYSYDQNYSESLKVAALLDLIYSHPKPVIARVNGPAIGGGVGLMAACDIVVASENAKFGFTEVSLGIAPAVISPYVYHRLGEQKTRELFITAEKITAEKARDFGLVNYVEKPENLDSAIESITEKIFRNGPEAISSVKTLLKRLSYSSGPDIMEFTAKMIADLRISTEGQEGMNAFLDKRKPQWID